MPLAIRMHIAGLTGKRAFTKAHVRAILLFVFESFPAATRTKSNLIEDLKALEEKHPACLIAAAQRFVDGNGTSSNIVHTSSINDAPDTNNAALLSEGIRIYLANETHKRAFKKNHITVILVHIFKYTPQRIAKKAELLDELKKQVETPPTLLTIVGAVAESAPAPLLPPPPPSAARANNSSAYWLYFACKYAVVTMASSLTPLELALHIYGTLIDTHG